MSALQFPLRRISLAPRAHLFTAYNASRAFSFAAVRNYADSGGFSNAFGGGPAPPRLPKEEQDLFEELQKQSTGAFSTPRAPPKINQSPDATPAETANADSIIVARAEKLADNKSDGLSQDEKDAFQKAIAARGDGEELHPNVRRGAKPEFEGDRNPKTGEVGGPKNEPLRWGASGEWTYNGRATDF